MPAVDGLPPAPPAGGGLSAAVTLVGSRPAPLPSMDGTVDAVSDVDSFRAEPPDQPLALAQAPDQMHAADLASAYRPAVAPFMTRAVDSPPDALVVVEPQVPLSVWQSCDASPLALKDRLDSSVERPVIPESPVWAPFPVGLSDVSCTITAEDTEGWTEHLGRSERRRRGRKVHKTHIAELTGGSPVAEPTTQQPACVYVVVHPSIAAPVSGQPPITGSAWEQPLVTVPMSIRTPALGPVSDLHCTAGSSPTQPLNVGPVRAKQLDVVSPDQPLALDPAPVGSRAGAPVPAQPLVVRCAGSSHVGSFMKRFGRHICYCALFLLMISLRLNAILALGVAAGLGYLW